MKSAQIKVLSDRDHVLLRPEMYIGNTETIIKKDWTFFKDNDNYVFTVKEVPFNEAYFKLFSEILDNSVDENFKSKGKFSNRIFITLLDRDHFIIEDNGRGVPTSKDKNSGKSQLEVAFTHLRAGSNFDKGTSTSESDINPGMNGVGASIVNVLADEFIVETEDENNRFVLKCTKNMENITCEKIHSQGKRGTKVEVKLSTKYFNDIHLITKEHVKTWLFKRVVELKTFYPDITFFFNNSEVTNTIFDYINPQFHIAKNGNKQMVIGFKNNDEESDMSFVNGLNTYEGGTHLNYVNDIVFTWLKKKLEKKFKPDHELKINDLQKRLFTIVALTGFPNAKFATQNKTKLISTKQQIQDYIPQSFVDRCCNAFFDTYENELRDMVDNIEAALLGKLAKKTTKARRQHIPKLIEANSKDKKNTKLFIVEGDSAASMFLQARDKQYHAAYPLRGKILNVYEKNLKTVLENDEIRGLLSVIGLEIGKQAHDINYGQICILTDADPDGDDITSLLLLLFYKFWPELFKQNKIIKISAPLLIAKKGKDCRKYFNLSEYDNERNELVEKGYSIEYYKGLGKMNKDEYREMIVHPTYTIINNIDDHNTKRVLNILFGKDTAERKQWLKGKDILKGE